MTDVAVDTLRLRGPHARRLAAVAARALPAALERAMAGVGDVRVERVEVRLDLDPADYDDQTLAVLWADAIRARVLAATPHPRPPARTAPSPPAPAPARTATPGEVLAVVRVWVAATSRSSVTPSTTVLPSAALALGDPAVARAVRGAAGPVEWARLLAALGTALRTPGRTTPATDRQGSPTVTPEVSEPDPVAPVAPAARPRPVDGTVGRHAPVPGERAEVLDMLAALAGLLAVSPGPAGLRAATRVADVDLSTVTRAAGLVLLYPWLADHCRRAEALHPGLAGLDVREAALAAIVDPDDPALADDHLIGLLAGRPGPPAEPRVRGELDRQDEVVESGARVLASFAALLPGFGDSTATFARNSWIRRLGVVHRDRDPALLLAATHPLDVVLPLLPYPIGLVKLPWSPPLSVRFAP
jgi:contractile injection system tape measure protein